MRGCEPTRRKRRLGEHGVPRTVLYQSARAEACCINAHDVEFVFFLSEGLKFVGRPELTKWHVRDSESELRRFGYLRKDWVLGMSLYGLNPFLLMRFSEIRITIPSS